MSDTTTVGTDLAPLPVSTDVKAGWLTTEFWKSLIFQIVACVIATAALFGKHLDGTQWQPFVGLGAILAASIANAAYSHSRAKVKAAQSLANAKALASQVL